MIKRPFLIMLLPLIALSCSNNELSVEDMDSVQVVPTKMLNSRTTELDPLFVTPEDINAYVEFLIVSGERKTEDIIGVTPYQAEDEVCFYVISFTDGWQMISSDKRGPVFLAESEHGSFEEVFAKDYLRLWMCTITQDIIIRRKLEDEYNKQISEEIARKELKCVDFWHSINPNSQSGEDFIMTKNNPGEIILLPDGHWELISATYDTIYGEIGHLISTHWHQHFPYNIYCPPKSAPGTLDKCPAGCVAVAGAQMLVFLHDTLGVPEVSPTIINYSGSQCVISGYSSSAWLYMDDPYSDIPSILVRDVGARVGMSYSDNSSTASTADLVDEVFYPYGISSTYQDYSLAFLQSSVANRKMPIIVRANGTVEYDFWGFPSYSNGHSFIVDNYKYYVIETTGTYRWIWDPHMQPLPMVDDTVMVTYSSPVYAYIQMNWGWGDIDDDDIYFVPSGSWEIINGDDVLHFDYNRALVYIYGALDE